MRLLATLATLCLTGSPHPDRPTHAAPAPSASAPQRPTRNTGPVPPQAEPAAVQHRELVVLAPGHRPEGRWIPRARDEQPMRDVDFRDLLVPPADAWPDDDVPQALYEALHVPDDAGEAELERAWAVLAEAVQEAGLDAQPPGFAGSEWDGYATLWLAYARSSGFFMTDDERQPIRDGLYETLASCPDGPLRDPLLFAVVLLDPEGEVPEDVLWELVEEGDERFARVGLEALLQQGEDIHAFDDLAFAPDGRLELTRRRLRVAAAIAEGTTPPLDELLAHPMATKDDRVDADELRLLARLPSPGEPWARALQAEAAACADLAPGDAARVQVRDGVWSTAGEGPLADCLYGWAWPQPVPDTDVAVRVVR